MYGPGGRGLKYNQALLDRAYEYLLLWDTLPNTVIPTISALCGYLGISEMTARTWRAEQEKKEFAVIMDEVERLQKNLLMQGGLGGRYNSRITQVLLSQHGVIEKKEQTIELGNAPDRRFEITFTSGSPAHDPDDKT